MKKLLAGVQLALACSFGAQIGSAQDCPNVRASYVPPSVTHSSTSERCGVGISLFGLGVSVFGPSCPAARFTTPGHGVCNGAPSPGNRCVPAGLVDVIYEKCECADATALGTGLLLPDCDCQVQPISGGTVENWRTKPCPTDN